MDDSSLDITADTEPGTFYSEGLALGELRFQRCDWCSTSLLRPRLLCAVCGSTELTWQRSTGRGRVVGSRQAPRKGHSPLTAVLVELDEGFSMESRLVSSTPAIVPVGARVRFGLVGEGAGARPVFRLEDTDWRYGRRRTETRLYPAMN
ncbi:Zn-ribbon domain-containing OB-fold protein [Peterkaempfera sp. SMS 1(5)a]|uniref:Zn-ribbon domain-containing OB-fold protein n=1 Tax=Peterkaempfera podocarpi TaxID=3232308 RepID=UPI00366BA950